MSAYFFEWLNLVLRWAHVIVGIAWIGSSFYFMWLDARLNVPPLDPESDDIAGDLWAVHGGGFYHAQKYKVAPQELPEPLHWFKWEAYSTWITGFLLLLVAYYLNADAYLVDKRVADISANQAIIISLVLLPVGWLIYDLLCRSGLSNHVVAGLGVLLIAVLSYGVTQVFGGRGAYMQVGAMLGTIMVANVFWIIIPSQQQLVPAKLEGRVPDAAFGVRAKQPSVHNNYLTLPVVFVMISHHCPTTYGHAYNWLVLLALFGIGALIRYFFNLRNQGNERLGLAALALVLLAVLAFAVTPRPPDPASLSRVEQHETGDVEVMLQTIFAARCNACHSASPTHPTAPVAPNGVAFDTLEQIQVWAGSIYDRVVVNQTMPLANLTQMTDEERAIVGLWFAQIGSGQ